MMPHNELFRPEALKALQSPEQAGLLLKAVRPASVIGLATLSAALCLAIVAACVIQVPIEVASEALLIGSKGMLELTISAQNEGRVLEVLVGERSRVAPGDLIARLDRPEVRLELSQAESERDQVAHSIEDINRLQTEMTLASKDVRDQALAHIEVSSRLLKEQLNSLQQTAQAVGSLRAKGIATNERAMALHSEMTNTLERLQDKYTTPLSFLIDELKETSQFKREGIQLEERLIAIQQRIARLSAQLRRESEVVSHDFGVVSEVKVLPGDLLKYDSLVVSLLPDADTLYRERPGPNRLIAVAFIPAESGKKVRPGMPALVDPLSVRRDVYGNMLGNVLNVSDVPLTPERTRQLLRNDELVRRLTATGAPFLAQISLKTNRQLPSGFEWTSSSGPETPITAGTLAQVRITTEHVPLIGLMVPALKDLFRRVGRRATSVDTAQSS